MSDHQTPSSFNQVCEYIRNEAARVWTGHDVYVKVKKVVGNDNDPTQCFYQVEKNVYYNKLALFTVGISLMFPRSCVLIQPWEKTDETCAKSVVDQLVKLNVNVAYYPL
jgi:hypothetical protein